MLIACKANKIVSIQDEDAAYYIRHGYLLRDAVTNKLLNPALYELEEKIRMLEVENQTLKQQLKKAQAAK